MIWELIFNQTLEDFFFLTLPVFYIVGMVFSFMGLPIFILFWKRWMPLPARTLFWASRRRDPPLILCHDSGRGEITTIRERRGEGIVITAQGKYKILPRWLPKFPVEKFMTSEKPQQQAEEQVTEEAEGAGKTGEDEEAVPEGIEPQIEEVVGVKTLHQNFMLDYSDWTVKRTNLIGLNLPMWFGYTGKLCLLNPEALALYEAGEMWIRTEDTVLFNPHKLKGKDGKEKRIEDALQPLLLLDPRKIQQIIYNGFDQSQIAGVVADSEALATLGMRISPKMKALLGIVVIVVLALLALLFLSGGLGGNPNP